MIDKLLLKKYSDNISDDDVNNLLINSISNNSSKKILLNRELVNNYNHIFSDKRKINQQISDQFNTGRCWIFSFNNILRNKLINQYKLKDDFNLSSNYFSFYDKLEKCNYFLDNIEHTKDNTLQDKLVEYFLDEPISDGGSWNMAINIIEKYGIVPEDIMKETYNSKNTSNLNSIIIQNLKRFSYTIRSTKKYDKSDMLYTIYKILCFFLGKPPTDFTWEYYNNDDKYNKHPNLTPSKFYKKFVKKGCKFNPKDYVICINYPLKRFPFYKVFKLNYCTNIDKNEEFICYNLPIREIKSLVKKSIDKDEIVFFGSDIGKYYYNKDGILDNEIYNYDVLFNKNVNEMSKGDKLSYRQSFPNHAMVIIGYNKQSNNINKWAVENTWGSNSGNKGYITMSSDWFDEYAYLFVIHKKNFTENQLNKYKKGMRQKISIQPWDILACEALVLN